MIENPVLSVGIILMLGYFLGQLAEIINLPQITGYIIAGLVLNPDVFHFFPKDILNETGTLTDLCLAFITFEVGAHLHLDKLKKSGKQILLLTTCESLGAFFFVFIGFLIVLFNFDVPLASSFIVPFGLLMVALSAPTDPSATLAVTHEYKAKGEVSDTVMGIAALDDLFGIILYSISLGFSSALMNSGGEGFFEMSLSALFGIGGAILTGVIAGSLFNFLSRFVQTDQQGIYIVLILAFLALSFGSSEFFGFDAVLSTLVMGVLVANYNVDRVKILNILERYTEQLVFIFFFVIGGLHLNFEGIKDTIPFIILFVLLRGIGKWGGIQGAARVVKASISVRKYVPGGLIPQGGIVIGLALMMQKTPEFNGFRIY